MKVKDLTKVLTPKYAGKWVALNENETKVVAAADNPGKARDEAIKKGEKKPVIMFAVKDYGHLYPVLNEVPLP